MVSYLTSIATVAVSHTVSEIPNLLVKNRTIFSPPLVFGAPIRGEAVGIQQPP